jgi:hypothetical protein
MDEKSKRKEENVGTQYNTCISAGTGNIYEGESNENFKSAIKKG